MFYEVKISIGVWCGVLRTLSLSLSLSLSKVKRKCNSRGKERKKKKRSCLQELYLSWSLLSYKQVTVGRLAFFITFEHVVFFIKVLAMAIIPDVPKGVRVCVCFRFCLF